ncbi:MAG TPA: chemotaxis protein CheD [Acidobacteriaceae bacterium]|jgi:chemotaxis receptor (MCP) glutamine deamidase CheD|nr:chemotaxis protein CheD [Acidobacteriaceae bacterium]
MTLLPHHTQHAHAGRHSHAGHTFLPLVMRRVAWHLHHEPSQRVDIGCVEASHHPLRLHTLLGSCVAVCLYDPVARAGGMNHILVPSSANNTRCGPSCGVHAMELLINAVMHAGGNRRRFVAKAFGAGNVLPVFRTPTVGELNAQFVREFLRTEHIPLVGERLGGNQAVRVIFHTDTGRAVVHTVDGSRLTKLIREEEAFYVTDPIQRFPDEEPTIF